MKDKIETFIRDVCSVAPKSKSEVRSRLNDIIGGVVLEMTKIDFYDWNKNTQELIRNKIKNKARENGYIK